MDSETEAILKELEKEYNIPLSEYAIDKDKLTYSGKAADFSVENYMYDGNGTEIFEVEGKEYIALLHPEEEIAMLYGFVEHEDESLELTEIVSDEEYELVSEAFNSIFDEEDEEDEETEA